MRQLTNGAGVVTDSYEYDAFGNEITHTGTTPNNYLYRGEQYDPDLSLYYLRARYYNPQTGRFMSRDPVDPPIFGSDGAPTNPRYLHKYLYANGDPTNGVDPTGRDDDEEYQFLFSKASLGPTLVRPIAWWSVRTLCYAVTALNVGIYIESGGDHYGPKSWPPAWKFSCGLISLAGGPPKFPKS